MKNRSVLMASITVVVIFVAIIIGNYIYNENNYFEKWLVCEYKTEYENYEETLNFVFIENVLYDFYREEYFEATETHSLDELQDYFLEQKKDVEELESDYFSYKIKKENEKLHITTYINALNSIDFYEDYIKDRDLNFEDTIDEITTELEDNYTCKIIKR